MGMPQTLLSIAALALLGLLVITINGSISSSNDANLRVTMMNMAVDIAQEKIDEISKMAFDEAATGGAVPANIPNDFTDVSVSGRGEMGDKDDVDDYATFNTPLSITRSTDLVFSISILVNYVNPASPSGSVSAAKTRMKRIEVVVTPTPDPFQVGGVHMFYYKSY